jgi:hypothetical protein
MIKDERISKAQNRIAARGFGIWYILLLAALLYRQFYLGQSVREYWDLAVIFFVGTAYVAMASYARGAVYETSKTRFAKLIVPVILITIVVVMFFQGRISSAVDFVEVVLSALIGLGLVGLVFYYLYRRWEKRNELTDG